jgi:hypothetical protein
MTKKTIFPAAILLVLIIPCFIRAQSRCKCPAAQDTSTTMSDSVFYFESGRALILCGNKDVDTRGATFSNFAVRVCGQDSVLGFWNENKTCRVSAYRDTLNIETLVNLPVGRDFGYLPVPLVVDKIFFAWNMPKRLTRINPKIRKYKPSECLSIVRKYERTPKPIADDLEDVMNKLFMAAISGDKRAFNLFMDFTKVNPELDADSQEQYNELLLVLGYFGRM